MSRITNVFYLLSILVISLKTKNATKKVLYLLKCDRYLELLCTNGSKLNIQMFVFFCLFSNSLKIKTTIS